SPFISSAVVGSLGPPSTPLVSRYSAAYTSQKSVTTCSLRGAGSSGLRISPAFLPTELVFTWRLHPSTSSCRASAPEASRPTEQGQVDWPSRCDLSPLISVGIPAITTPQLSAHSGYSQYATCAWSGISLSSGVRASGLRWVTERIKCPRSSSTA